MRIVHISAVGLVCLALSACAPESGGAPTGSAAASGGQDLAANAKPVSAERAKAIFDAVCGASLPRFDTAPQRMAAQGFTRTSTMATGTMFSATENASFRIMDGPGASKKCSFVIGTKDQPDTVRQAMAGGEKIGSTSVPDLVVWLYKGQKTLVFSGPSEKRANGETIMSFQMLSER